MSGSVPCIVVSTAAVAREIFQTQDATFSSRPKLLAFKLLKDDQNMATSPYGPYWRQLRKIANSELFSPRRHASYANARAEEIRFMMQVLVDESRRGEAINLRSWLHGVTDNIMTQMLMNRRYSKTWAIVQLTYLQKLIYRVKDRSYIGYCWQD